MKHICFFLLALLSGVAGAMTPQEFQQLYESKDKTAEVCYQLYQAYAQGDGVAASESQARKWLLAAHDSGMLSTRKEISTQPWRRKAKLKPSIKIAEVSDEEARELGRELVQFMLDNGGRNLIGMNMLPESKPAKELVAGVKQRIAAGADLNVCVTEQNDMVAATALYLACKMGDEGLINMLLNHGADPNFHGSLALTAFYMPDRPKMNTSMPLLGGGTLSARNIRKMQKRDGKEGKNLEKRVRKLFNLLVKKGADVRAWSHVGWSPIYAAVNANSPLGVQMLVKAGADPDQKQNPHEVANHTLSARRISYSGINRQIVLHLQPQKSQKIGIAAVNGVRTALAGNFFGFATQQTIGGQLFQISGRCTQIYCQMFCRIGTADAARSGQHQLFEFAENPRPFGISHKKINR